MCSGAMIYALGGEQGKTNGMGLDGVSSLDGHTCFLILDADGRVDHHLLWGTRPDHHVFCPLTTSPSSCLVIVGVLLRGVAARNALRSMMEM